MKRFIIIIFISLRLVFHSKVGKWPIHVQVSHYAGVACRRLERIGQCGKKQPKKPNTEDIDQARVSSFRLLNSTVLERDNNRSVLISDSNIQSFHVRKHAHRGDGFAKGQVSQSSTSLGSSRFIATGR